MAKYSKAAQKNVGSAMKRMEKGTLKSGRSGKKVTNPKQAIAIGLSEAREKGTKVPKKAAGKKTANTRTTAKKTVTKKATVKKAAPKRAVAKKTTVTKKAVQRKPVVKRAGNQVEKETPVLPVEVKNNTLPPVEEKSAEVKPVIPQRTGDPMMITDKRALAKAITKHDPRHHFQASGAKHSIRPSGKKPLWR